MSQENGLQCAMEVFEAFDSRLLHLHPLLGDGPSSSLSFSHTYREKEIHTTARTLYCTPDPTDRTAAAFYLIRQLCRLVLMSEVESD